MTYFQTGKNAVCDQPFNSPENLATVAKSYCCEKHEPFIAFQVDMVLKLIPELVQLLRDKDESAVRGACQLIADLTKSEAACRVVNSSPQLLSALGKTLEPRRGGVESKNDIMVSDETCD